MAPIYKYLKKEHLEDFRINGSVFLNTLNNLTIVIFPKVFNF